MGREGLDYPEGMGPENTMTVEHPNNGEVEFHLIQEPTPAAPLAIHITDEQINLFAEALGKALAKALK